jgi:hypothetical protein
VVGCIGVAKGGYWAVKEEEGITMIVVAAKLMPMEKP